MTGEPLGLLSFRHWRRVGVNPFSYWLYFSAFASFPFFFTEPKDPPKNVTVTAVPEEVNLVRVSFSPPEEPNGNITTYYLFVYEKDRLIKNMSLDNIHGEPNMLVAFIEGLKGGHTYSIQVRNSYCM